MAPSASTACNRRVSTCWRDSRQAPSARNTVSTTGISSGRMDMARAMPSNRLSSSGRRSHSQAISTSATASATPRMARPRTSRREARCNCDSVSPVPASAWPMRPIALAAPVAVTTARPTPLVISVPANSSEFPAADPGAACAAAQCGDGIFWQGMDSPVSSDSSLVTCPSTSQPSAATRSPSCSTMRSPRTTSALAMRSSWPSRTTRARGDDRSRKASSARCARCSWIKVRATTPSTETSRNSASPTLPMTR